MTPWLMRECACPGCLQAALPGDEFCVLHIYEVEAEVEAGLPMLERWLAKVKA